MRSLGDDEEAMSFAAVGAGNRQLRPSLCVCLFSLCIQTASGN